MIRRNHGDHENCGCDYEGDAIAAAEDAGLLRVGCPDVRPANGPAVILLHDWPYDIHSDVEVAPQLAATGNRAIEPYSRGFGSTTFRSRDTFRNAQQSAVALDVIALMDALKIDLAIVAGFDWSSRTAAILAHLEERLAEVGLR